MLVQAQTHGVIFRLIVGGNAKVYPALINNFFVVVHNHKACCRRTWVTARAAIGINNCMARYGFRFSFRFRSSGYRCIFIIVVIFPSVIPSSSRADSVTSLSLSSLCFFHVILVVILTEHDPISFIGRTN